MRGYPQKLIQGKDSWLKDAKSQTTNYKQMHTEHVNIWYWDLYIQKKPQLACDNKITA